MDPATGGDCSALFLPGDTTNPAKGSVAANGTITMTLDFSSAVTFGTCASTGGTDMTINPSQWTPGTQITNIQGTTSQRAGGVINGVKVTKAQTTGDGTYTLKGNVSCLGLMPIAALAAAPTSGAPPLAVNFNGTSSHEPAGACGVINSYTLNFGDGTPPETNATGTFSHTYATRRANSRRN